MIALYIVLGILSLIVILLLIALVHTMFVKVPKEEKPLDIDFSKANSYAKRFSEMIKVKTISYNKKEDNYENFVKLKEVMKGLFPKVFETMEIKEFPGESLILKWSGKSSNKPLVLMSHIDVVPAVDNAWDYPPFSGKIVDGTIYGRGTLDTKSTVYCFYQACEELIESGYIPDNDVYLASSTDEETSGFGASLTVEWLKDNGVKPFLVVDEGGTVLSDALPSMKRPMAVVGILEKGYVDIKLTAKSFGGHSSTPPKNTPIARLSKFVSDVEGKFPLKTKMIKEVETIFKNAAPAMSGINKYLFSNMWLFKGLLTWLLPKMSPFGRALLSTTIAFTMMKGSDAENVIPAEAYMIANLRTHPIQGVDESFMAIKKLAQKYDIEAEIISSREASSIVDINGEGYIYLEKTIKNTFPDAIVSPYVMLGGTDCRFYSEVSDAALRFSPVRMNNDELKKMHGNNESIRISVLVEAIHFYQELIKNNK
ncbi:MAG: M20/M25/M40 family metallo-hydrolase [Candidatus Izemoplasmatales bacterium]|nr:M20/M25/M40 family metallo-hydrolase [Candidatus Izemoplasmatales bacterium]MDD4069724.1 M20/M25/M40 family metallo-hydrolase [Candidatus Izemoplasmatales bacterium]